MTTPVELDHEDDVVQTKIGRVWSMFTSRMNKRSMWGWYDGDVMFSVIRKKYRTSQRLWYRCHGSYHVESYGRNMEEKSFKNFVEMWNVLWRRRVHIVARMFRRRDMDVDQDDHSVSKFLTDCEPIDSRIEKQMLKWSGSPIRLNWRRQKKL